MRDPREKERQREREILSNTQERKTYMRGIHI